jgi:hypothetical protein
MILNAQELELLFRRIQREPGRPPAADTVSMWDKDAACALVSSPSKGLAAVMIQLDAPGPTVGRITEGLSLSSLVNAIWTSGGEHWEGPGALLECRNDEFLPTFSVLIADLLQRFRSLGAIPSWGHLLNFLEDWESLFARTFAMSEIEQLGLWGELKLIQQSNEMDEAISAWIADSSARTDFMRAAVSLEVKTSRRRAQHHVSLVQTQAPDRENSAYLVSLWVELDESTGASLPDLVLEIASRASDPTDFERKLMQRGYSRLDAGGYSFKWRLLGTPRLYPVDELPKIRQIDPGISNVRYVVALDERLAVDEQRAASILAAALAVTV